MFDAKVAVYGIPLDSATTETKGTVLLKSAEELKAYNNSEEDALENILKRKGRMDELSLMLTKAHIGVSQLEARLSTVPRLQLRGGPARDLAPRHAVLE